LIVVGLAALVFGSDYLVQAFSGVMMGFVVPLTLVTLVVAMIRRPAVA